MYIFFKWLIAIILIIYGVALVLQNVGFISTEIFSDFWASWPLILIVLGLISLINRITPGKSGSWQVGSFLIIFGGLLWAGNYDLIDFQFSDIWQLWPLILVYIGTSLLFNRGPTVQIIHPGNYDKKAGNVVNVEVHTGVGDDDENESGSSEEQRKKKNNQSGTYTYNYNYKYKYPKNSRRFIADQDFSSNNWEVQSMNLWTAVGDLYFDFSKAFIPDQESTIELKGYVADIQMLIPENIPVKIYARVSIGEVMINEENQSGFSNTIIYETDGYDEATRKLNIIMKYQVGEINVAFV